MKRLLMLCALAALAGCASGRKTKAAAPDVSCRADENFENGRCVPRIPGDGKPPGGLPPWTRP